jgi:hypothetical protein
MKDDEQASGLERTQVNLRLERRIVDEIDELARRTHADRTEVVRRLLGEALETERVRNALGEYVTGKVTAWQAARGARISLYEMLDRISEAGVPHEVDEAVFVRLRGAQVRPPRAGPSTGGRDRTRRGPKQPTPTDRDSGISELRERYRPGTVRLLFVGESSPAGGTHFYRADSNLYRAMRDAFAEVFEGVPVPVGEAFLEWFRGLGCWLVDLVDRPVDRLSAAARKRAVQAGADVLASTIESRRPSRIIVVKRDVAAVVRRAARTAGYDGSLVDVVPFPLYQWRRQFIEQVAAIARVELAPQAGVTDSSQTNDRPVAVAEPGTPYAATLHDAIETVVAAAGGGPISYQAIAREIARQDLWRRPADGGHPSPSQISARINHYPQLFQKTERGVRLRVRRPRARSGMV